MTTIRQLIQTSPVRANELFAKLVDTSDTAVKTRDRLFSQLKSELDLKAVLEEQHLFPVLKKHKKTKGLVTVALKGNRETRKLVAELERTPKDSEEFGYKVAQLRTNFRQQVRNDKKEFLPAVVKALSDEEASTVVANIEDEKAQIEASQLAEVNERRAGVKHEREQVKVANAARAKAKFKRAQRGTNASQAKASIVARKTENEQRKAPRAAPKSDANGVIKMKSAVQVAAGSAATQELVRETNTAPDGLSIMSLLKEQSRHAMEASLAVGRARTLAEFTKVQSDFIGSSIRRLGQFNERYFIMVSGGMRQ